MYQLLCYIYPLVICGWDPPQVTTKWSRIEGIKDEIDGRRVNTFLGIPYAEPPLDELRFRPPVPLRSVSFLQYYAGNFRSACLDKHYHEKSFGSRFIDESEDCLYLNVWSPEDSLEKGKLRPVLVFLHHVSTDVRQINGKVLSGLGDVTVVTFNYRTGLFGLIQDDSKESLDSAIYHDTRAALEWVRENIKLFGGDSNRITLIADGWEGIRVGLALDGKLFQQLIISNGPLNPDEDLDLDWTAIKAIGEVIGCKPNTLQQANTVIDCLRRVDARSLFQRYVAVNDTVPRASSGFIISPSVWSRVDQASSQLSGQRLSGPVLSIQINTDYDFNQILSSTEKVSTLMKLGESMQNSIELSVSSSPGSEYLVNKTLTSIPESQLIRWTLKQLSECPLLRLTESLAQGNDVYSLLVDATYHGMKSRPSLFRQVDIFAHRGLDLLSGSPLLEKKIVRKEVQSLSQELVKIIGHFVRKGKAKWPRLSEPVKGQGGKVKEINQYRISTEQCSLNPDFSMKAQFCEYIKLLF